MSSEPGVARLLPERKRCGLCRKSLRVQKTRTRNVTTIDGESRVTEVTLFCPRHRSEVYRPERIAPSRSSFGYDLVTEVGRLRCIEHKQVWEMREELSLRGAMVPARTLHRLCDRFLLHVVAVHMESMNAVAGILRRRGGYVLQVDGTSTKGSPALALMKDGWSGIRLLAASVVSEGEEFISPHLATLKERLGSPVAAVRDNSEGIMAAIRKVFPGTYGISCHYHFLRDVGLKLFDPVYPSFRNRVDRRGVKKRLRSLRRALRRRRTVTDESRLSLELVEHILAYKEDGDGLAYPFSLPAADLYRRCEDVSARVRKAILDRAADNVFSPDLSKLEDVLRLLKPPPNVLGRLHAEFLGMEERWRWFQRVRRALRYRNGPVPLSTKRTLSERELEKGRVMLDGVRSMMEQLGNGGGGRRERSLQKALRKVAMKICEHRDELLAPNVSVVVDGERKVRRLPRTNATVEMDFRSLRRHGRRIRGNADVEGQVQRDGPGMLIALNLLHQDYVRAVYGSLDRMAERFSHVSPATLSHAKRLMAVPDV